MRVTLKQLIVFDAVARLGFVNQAAAEICLSQSATSMALQDLEKNLGAQLFHRHKKQLALNENGRRLQPLVRSLLNQAREIELSADKIEGRLNIGASSTIGQYVLPKVCAAFLAEFPNVNIHLTVGASGDLISRVDDMVVDVGFIETPCNRHSLTSVRLGEDQLHVVVGSNHRLAKKRSSG